MEKKTQSYNTVEKPIAAPKLSTILPTTPAVLPTPTTEAAEIVPIINKEEYSAADIVYDSTPTVEQNGDFIIPDYLPDARKILLVEGVPEVTGRFIGAGALEYEGNTNYKVLFADENAAVRQVEFAAPFQNKINLADIIDDTIDILLPRVESLVGRLVNPRKISIKNKVGGRLSLWNKKSYAPSVGGAKSIADERSLERKTNTLVGTNILSARETELKASHDIALAGNEPNIGELLWQNAKILIDDARSTDGKLGCKGNLVYNAFYRPEGDTDGKVTHITRTLPISETLEFEHLSDAYKAHVSEIPGRLATHVQSDATGERRVIEIDYDYGLDVEAAAPKPVCVVEDVYSTARRCENSTKKVTIPQIYDTVKGNFTSDILMPISEIAPNGISRVIAPIANVNLEVTTGQDNKLSLAGTAVFTTVVEDADGMPTNVTVNVPVRFDTDKILPMGTPVGKVNSAIDNIRARLDDGNIVLTFETLFSGIVYINNEVTIVDGTKLTGDPVSTPGCGGIGDNSRILLYYPDRGESLWSVAKKYATTKASLIKANSIADETKICAGPIKICR